VLAHATEDRALRRRTLLQVMAAISVPVAAVAGCADDEPDESERDSPERDERENEPEENDDKPDERENEPNEKEPDEKENE
jgi:hypothetical protein